MYSARSAYEIHATLNMKTTEQRHHAMNYEKKITYKNALFEDTLEFCGTADRRNDSFALGLTFLNSSTDRQNERRR